MKSIKGGLDYLHSGLMTPSVNGSFACTLPKTNQHITLDKGASLAPLIQEIENSFVRSPLSGTGSMMLQYGPPRKGLRLRMESPTEKDGTIVFRTHQIGVNQTQGHTFHFQNATIRDGLLIGLQRLLVSDDFDSIDLSTLLKAQLAFEQSALQLVHDPIEIDEKTSLPFAHLNEMLDTSRVNWKTFEIAGDPQNVVQRIIISAILINGPLKDFSKIILYIRRVLNPDTALQNSASNTKFDHGICLDIQQAFQIY